MKPIDPAELSALLDGELPSDRAEALRQAIGRDESLRREYEELVDLHAELNARAEAAVFRPRLEFPPSPEPCMSPVLAAAAVLLIARFAVKFVPALFGTGVQVLLLGFVVGWLLQRVIRSWCDGAGQVVRELGLLTPRG